MPKPSYAYAVGNVRARETALLTRSDLEQLLSQTSDAGIAAFLRDKGYGDPAGDAALDELLRREREKIWAEAIVIAPDPRVFDPFFYANDVHNFKVVLKGLLRQRDYRSLLLQPGTVAVELLEDAVRETRFDRLPDWLAPAAEKSRELFLQTGDAQLSDGLLDAALQTAQLEAAKKSRIPLLERYFTLTVFYDNVKAALRAALADKSAVFLQDTLCAAAPEVDALAKSALRGTDAVLSFLERQVAFGGPEAAAAFRRSPSEFERFVDNQCMALARTAKYTTLGAEPLIGYLLARLGELKAVQIVASGIRTGQEAGQIRERLRDLYG